LVFLKDFFRENGYSDRQIHRAFNRRPHLPQPDNSQSPSCPLSEPIQPYKQIVGPTQHQIIQSPPSGQGPPRTKDTRSLQELL
jgi:hypothetical protein